MKHLAALDTKYVWHPFTQMRDWMRSEPIVIVRGRGAVLQDDHGHKYLDANSSIWTNLHGHNHPKINAALRRQLGKIAHSSALGLANEPASLLAERLIVSANRRAAPAAAPERLARVFFSDDGATAMEVAVKLAAEYTRRTGRARRPKFLSLAGAYHGDTLGAAAVGQSKLFHGAWSSMMFKTDEVMSPYCYRCPYNRARPERADAREYRRCHWECLEVLERKLAARRRKAEPYAAFVFEPLMQGAAGMIPQPAGWLARAAALAHAHGALLIADEVMTGFGRTGGSAAGGRLRPRHSADMSAHSKVALALSALGLSNLSPLSPNTTGRAAFPVRPEAALLFACQQEGVIPDFMVLAKGLTGGYLPMAATLTTRAVFNAFLGEYGEFKTFFHGHSYTGNQLGASAALASLEVLESAASARTRAALEQEMRRQLRSLWEHRNVGDIRQVGLVAGVELVRNWRTREAFDLRRRAGQRVCEAMARRGVLTRPIGNVLVLMPPYCVTAAQVRTMVRTMGEAIAEVF